ncbi:MULTISPECIES: MerR family transcriptional regulator [Actinosynnema]|uniref:MerR family transcriptional regulator n=1 Tax=Actinosynnema TaxID=40566 RepID=UPI0020A56CC3|nr:MerR family transcriptional regulator [Actinosynnema pretiosum]MCP2096570.1 DNA-binding transcriptional regulator, MerR family [Actinosynnema pretiosum]
MRIGELAGRTGVSGRSLRYYEQQGLLTATRTSGGHREYPEPAVERVRRIQALYAAGLCSAKIAELLPCMSDADGSAVAGSTALVESLRVERARLDRAIVDLTRSRELLDEAIVAAETAPQTL